MLEDELREMFAAVVTGSPAMSDPAGRAIRRARRIRRRHRTVAGALCLVTMLLVGMGALVVRQRMAPVPMDSQPLIASIPDSTGSAWPPISLDVRVGNALVTADGRRLPLPDGGDITWVYRVPFGWVYGGTAGKLLILRGDGTAIDPSIAADVAVVSPDGLQLAWSTGTSGRQTLRIGRLGAGGVRTVEKTPLKAAAVPVGFVGNGVVLGRVDNTGRLTAYDYWDPTGEFQPTWNDQIASVYGDNGSHLVGLVSKAPGSPDGCLAYFEPDRTEGLRRLAAGGCGMGLIAGSTRGAMSPDRAWVADQTSSGIVFVQASAASPTDAKTGGRCPVQGRTAPVWEGSTDVLVATGTGVVRCGINGTIQSVPVPVPVPGLAGLNWDLVPALGASTSADGVNTDPAVPVRSPAGLADLSSR